MKRCQEPFLDGLRADLASPQPAWDDRIEPPTGATSITCSIAPMGDCRFSRTRGTTRRSRRVLAEAVERTRDAALGLLRPAQPLAFDRLAPQGWRAVAVRRLADADPHAALARPSPLGRLGPRLSRTIQVVSDSGGRALSDGRPVRGTERAAGEAVRRAEDWRWGSLYRWLRGSAADRELLAAWPLSRKRQAGSSTSTLPRRKPN